MAASLSVRAIMFRLLIAAATAAIVTAAPAVMAQTVSPQTGEALYNMHCSACHSTQIHWRDNKLASNWAGLRTQVRRWQGNQNLNWSESDIDAVSRYLNTLYYRYPADEGVVGMGAPR
jgi:mono/diheme cytochrome c family protein